MQRDPLAYVDGMSLYQYLGSSPVHSVDPIGTFNDSTWCDEEELAAIRKAEAAARPVAADAFNVLEHEYKVHQIFTKWEHQFQGQDYQAHLFVASSAKRWYDKLDDVLAVIDHGYYKNEYGVECECYCLDNSYAYVYPDITNWGDLDSDIHFCPSFFELNATEQAKTFFHEMSHYFADTNDTRLPEFATPPEPWDGQPNDAYWLEKLITVGPHNLYNVFLQNSIREALRAYQ